MSYCRHGLHVASICAKCDHDLPATPTPQAQAGDDGLQGVWPHPISGWVRGADFIAASGDDAESRLAHGWQPASHVPPSFAFDPSPQAPARDAGAVAWLCEWDQVGGGVERDVALNPDEWQPTPDRVRPLIYGDTHPAAASDDARDAARYRWLAKQAFQNTAHDRYGDGGHWTIGFYSADNRRTFDAAIDAALTPPDGRGEGSA